MDHSSSCCGCKLVRKEKMWLKCLNILVKNPKKHFSVKRRIFKHWTQSFTKVFYSLVLFILQWKDVNLVSIYWWHELMCFFVWVCLQSNPTLKRLSFILPPTGWAQSLACHYVATTLISFSFSSCFSHFHNPSWFSSNKSFSLVKGLIQILKFLIRAVATLKWQGS